MGYNNVPRDLQALHFSRRTFMRGFIAVFLILCLFVPFTGSSPAEASPARSETKAIHALNRIQKKVATTLNVIDANLARAATDLSKSGITGPDARRIIRDLCSRTSHAIDCATVDPAGVMALVEPSSFSKFEGSDIGKQEQVILLHTSLKPVFSHLFRSVEGDDAVDLEYPVFSQKNELIGSVSILLKPSSLLWKPSHDEVRGTHFEVRVMERDGRLLFSTNKDETGKPFFQDALYKDYPELLSLGWRISEEKAGTETYRSIGKDRKGPVQKGVVWTTVSLHGTEWRIILSKTIR
jgi:hypothetical protein